MVFFNGEIHQRSQDHYSHTISKNGPLRFNIARKTYRLFVPVTRKCECAGYLAACIPELPIVSPPEGIYTASWLHCFTLMSIHFFLLLLLSHTSAAKWMYTQKFVHLLKKKTVLAVRWLMTNPEIEKTLIGNLLRMPRRFSPGNTCLKVSHNSTTPTPAPRKLASRSSSRIDSAWAPEVSQAGRVVEVAPFGFGKKDEINNTGNYTYTFDIVTYPTHFKNYWFNYSIIYIIYIIYIYMSYYYSSTLQTVTV